VDAFDRRVDGGGQQIGPATKARVRVSLEAGGGSKGRLAALRRDGSSKRGGVGISHFTPVVPPRAASWCVSRNRWLRGSSGKAGRERGWPRDNAVLPARRSRGSAARGHDSAGRCICLDATRLRRSRASRSASCWMSAVNT